MPRVLPASLQLCKDMHPYTWPLYPEALTASLVHQQLKSHNILRASSVLTDRLPYHKAARRFITSKTLSRPVQATIGDQARPEVPQQSENIMQHSTQAPNGLASSKSASNYQGLQQQPGSGSQLQGLLLMATVACMWGTSPVATRALYALPGPPSPAALGTAQAAMAFVMLTMLKQFAGGSSWAQAPNSQPSNASSSESHPHVSHSQDQSEDAAMSNRGGPSQAADGSAQPSGRFDVEASEARHTEESSSLLQTSGRDDSKPMQLSLVQSIWRTAGNLLNRPASNQMAAGAELGAISAAANAATLMGFQDTLAARGAFLLRMSVMFTPILAIVAREQTPTAVWLGAGTAFIGGLLIAGDDLSSQGHASSSLLSLSPGDALLIVAALLWALQTTRQGRLARQFPPIHLAAAQMGFMALGMSLWLAITTISDVSNGESWTAVWPGALSLKAWLIAAWPAVFPWGLGGVLQLRAQNMISPTLTNIVLATDPLWATLFSGVLGSGENQLGFQGWLGGGAILLACVIASQGNQEASSEQP